MIVVENFRIALRAIYANKMRSILTTLGIIIGVAAVVAVVSIVQGMSYMIAGQLQDVGATYMMVFPNQDPNDPAVSGKDVKLTLDDAEAIRRECPAIAALTPIIWRSGNVTAGGRKWQAFVVGVNEEYPDIVNHFVETGRFITHHDIEARKHITLVGQTVVDELKLGPDPIGKQISFSDTPLTVVGVMEKVGQQFGQDQDSILIVPYTTAAMIFGETASRQMRFDMKAASEDVVDVAKDQVITTLRKQHRIKEGQGNDFRIMHQEEILKTVTSILGSVTLVVGAVVSIALLVGGIGIMNIMLVSVTERTREIGLRKAVGARRRDILVQFLIEAVTLCLVGGMIGLFLGWGLGTLGAKAIPGFPPAHVPIWAIFLSLGFASGVGVLFGIYPAYKAARLNPIQALRYE
ncbi:MAG TPA: ABC transporter permease [Thermoanaerobaculia bacterium]|nr:ABC transporter permease [Thermoanaerobaculia bacterium]HUM29263.1 ABC transporter permease [Thermoanaerobaculia bacterium]HXK67779.1 ABC transporter permease [Thermoanaerobaculia bacterium]